MAKCEKEIYKNLGKEKVTPATEKKSSQKKIGFGMYNKIPFCR